MVRAARNLTLIVAATIAGVAVCSPRVAAAGTAARSAEPGCGAGTWRVLSPSAPLVPCAGTTVQPTGGSTAQSAGGLPCTVVPAGNVNDRCPSWSAEYTNPLGSDSVCGGLGSPAAETMTATSLVVTGWTCVTDNGVKNLDIATVAYRLGDGSVLWTDVYDGPAHGTDVAWDVAASPDGSRVFVAGIENSTAPDAAYFDNAYAAGGEFVVIAYDAQSGSELWTSAYSGAGGGNEATQVRVSDDGARVYVAGVSADAPGGAVLDEALVAYDAVSGGQLWSLRRQPAAPDNYLAPLGLRTDAGSVYVAGDAAQIEGGNAAALAIDVAAVGDDRTANVAHPLWQASYTDGTQPGPQVLSIGHGIAVAGGGVIVGGSSFGAGGITNTICATGAGGLVLRFDERTGHLDWARAAQSAGGEFDSEAVTASAAADAVYLAGFGVTTPAPSCSYDALAFAYDLQSGAPAWSSDYRDPLGGDAEMYTVTASPDGGSVVMSGLGIDFADVEQHYYLTLCYAASGGSPRWVGRWSGSSAAQPDSVSEFDEAYLSEVTSDGSAVVVSGAYDHFLNTTNDQYGFGTIEYSLAAPAAVVSELPAGLLAVPLGVLAVAALRATRRVSAAGGRRRRAWRPARPRGRA